MAPTIFREGAFRFFFFSREEARMHIHVAHTDGEAKFWMEPKIEIALNPDNSLGREMMARRLARQFCCLGGVHGHSMDDEQAAKMAAKRPPALA